MPTSKSNGATPSREPGSDPASGGPKRVRRVRTAVGPGAPMSLPAERLGDGPPAANEAAIGLADAPSAVPDIDEDGSWIEADAVEVHQGAVGRVDATEITVTQGAIGAVKGEHITVNMGAVGAALGGQVNVAQGMAGTVLAQEARLEQTFVRTLIAREVSISRPSAVVFLVAQRVSGEVKVLLDWRGAVAFGAAFGLLAGILGLGRRRR